MRWLALIAVMCGCARAPRPIDTTGYIPVGVVRSYTVHSVFSVTEAYYTEVETDTGDQFLVYGQIGFLPATTAAYVEPSGDHLRLGDKVYSVKASGRKSPPVTKK